MGTGTGVSHGANTCKYLIKNYSARDEYKA